jgi:GNAT superfamily N-acetyltransferase
VPIDLRELQTNDLVRLAAARGGAAWKGVHEKWKRYLAEHTRGLRVVLLADTSETIVAYGSLAWASQNPSFRSAGIPEIQDLVVAEDHRRTGLGTRLIRALEARAKDAGYSQVGIGVGLYRDYGAAQRLYCRLGYVPDGQGVSYKNLGVPPLSKVRVDDDLVLWLVRQLAET